MTHKLAKKAAKRKPAATSAKHSRFISEYLKDQNATQAAIRAGYSEKTAKQQGSRLLTNADIASSVQQGLSKIAKKAEVTVESLAIELEEARGIALTEKQTSAAVAATLGKAKLFGLGVEHRRLSGHLQLTTITADDLKGLTRDELALLEAALPVLQKIGLADGDHDEEEAA